MALIDVAGFETPGDALARNRARFQVHAADQVDQFQAQQNEIRRQQQEAEQKRQQFVDAQRQRFAEYAAPHLGNLANVFGQRQQDSQSFRDYAANTVAQNLTNESPRVLPPESMAVQQPGGGNALGGIVNAVGNVAGDVLNNVVVPAIQASHFTAGPQPLAAPGYGQIGSGTQEAIGQQATTSYVPQSALDQLRQFPVLGPTAADLTQGVTSPAGLVATFANPGLGVAGLRGAFTAGVAGDAAQNLLQDVGVNPPVNLRTVAELGGGFRQAGAEALNQRLEGLDQALSPTKLGVPDAAGVIGPGGVPRGMEIAGGASNAEDDLVHAFQQAAPKSTDAWAQQMEQWRQIRGERTSNFAAARDEYIAQGMAPNDAMLAARATLSGNMPVLKGAFGVDFTPEQQALFWDKALNNLQEYEQTNLAKAIQEVADTGRNFKPFEWGLIEKTMGRNFRQVAEASAIVKEHARIGSFPADWNPAEANLGSSLTRAQPQQGEIGLQMPALATSQGTHGPMSIAEQRVAALSREQLQAQMAGPSVGTSGGITMPAPTGEGAKIPTLPGLAAPASKASEVLPQTTPHIIDIAADSLGFPRAVMSSGDLSVPRQLEKTIARHPVITAGAMRNQIAAANPKTGEAFAVKMMEDFRAEGTNGQGYTQRVLMPDGSTREIGLGPLLQDRYMAVPGTPEYATAGVMKRPEFFISRWATNRPVIKQGGRAFAAGWNTQMQGLNRYWLQRFSAMNGGVLTSKQVEATLNLTDRLLGKGVLGESWFAQTLKALGFAPGYRVSGPQAWATLLSPRTDPQIRRMAAEELLTWTTAGNMILTAAKYGAGASVVLDPGAVQFGRIKFPGSNTYYNIWGTDNVLARTVLQALAKKKIDTQGNVTPLGNQKGGVTGFLTAATDATWQYLRSGEDPILGLITDLASGNTYTGGKLKWNAASVGKLVSDRLPMIYQDLRDVATTDGPIQALVSAPFAAFGGGISSYTPTGEQFKALPTFNTASLDATQRFLPNATQPLDLTANEERTLRDFLGANGPVHQWQQQQEQQYGPKPDNVTQEMMIRKVAQDQGLDPRMTAGALWLSKALAGGDLTVYNPKWVQFALTHESELKDRFPGTFNLHAIDVFRQNAKKAGLIPQ